MDQTLTLFAVWGVLLMVVYGENLFCAAGEFLAVIPQLATVQFWKQGCALPSYPGLNDTSMHLQYWLDDVKVKKIK